YVGKLKQKEMLMDRNNDFYADDTQLEQYYEWIHECKPELMRRLAEDYLQEASPALKRIVAALFADWLKWEEEGYWQQHEWRSREDCWECLESGLKAVAWIASGLPKEITASWESWQPSDPRWWEDPWMTTMRLDSPIDP